MFIENIKTLKSFSDPSGYFPPAVQWISKTPIFFPVQNIILWGAGLGLVILSSFFVKSKKNFLVFISLFWILFLLFIQGKEFSHTMRYFLPIYPYICILSALGFTTLKYKIKLLLFLIHILYCFSFLNIYLTTNSRVEASRWIYKNIQQDKILTYEYWDDPLPLNIDNKLNQYQSIKLTPYDLPDKPDKLSEYKKADYIIFSSNRLWASIPKVPDKYPYTSTWYKDIFSKMPYKKFVVYPGFKLPIKKCYYFGPTDYPTNNTWFEIQDDCANPGIYLRDDTAEEAFTVYDHPQVLIFKR